MLSRANRERWDRHRTKARSLVLDHGIDDARDLLESRIARSNDDPRDNRHWRELLRALDSL